MSTALASKRRLTSSLASLAFVAATGAVGGALAAGTHAGGHGSPIGEPGNAAQATRTIEVTAGDNFYEPERIEVKAGETVRFVVTNTGQLVHEFNIGTPEMHAAHQKEMAMMVDHGVLHPDRVDMQAAADMQDSMGHGMHEEPNSALLEPGQTAEIVWTFAAPMTLEFACNVPGHYDAGMVGSVDVVE